MWRITVVFLISTLYLGGMLHAAYALMQYNRAFIPYSLLIVVSGVLLVAVLHRLCSTEQEQQQSKSKSRLAVANSGTEMQPFLSRKQPPTNKAPTTKAKQLIDDHLTIV